jgi:hypothetical protein
MKKNAILQAAAFACLGIVVIGCSKEVEMKAEANSLSGTIKFNGEQVYFATVMVQAGPTVSNGTVGEDGKYLVNNLSLGECLIGVNTDMAKGNYASATMSERYAGPQSGGKAPKAKKKFIDVPAKYQDPKGSGIKTTIAKGANTFDITIGK